MTNPYAIAQTFLQNRGFYHGAIDGDWGPLSTAAAEAWQSSQTNPCPVVALSAAAPSDVSDKSSPSVPSGHVIDSTGWYTGATRKPISGGSSLTPIGLIIHATAGATAQSSIDGEPPGVCAHFYIDRDGTVYQTRSCLTQCGHAGVSAWHDPKTGEMLRNLNSCTIGIEHANAESDPGALAWARKQTGFSSIRATSPEGGGIQEWECYPYQQIAASIALTQAILAAYPLHFIAGHEQVAPDRRDDPGPAWPWSDYRAAINFNA